MRAFRLEKGHKCRSWSILMAVIGIYVGVTRVDGLPCAPPNQIGNCTNTTQCCSQYGYCGNDADHCGVNCRSGPCYAYPPIGAPPPAGPNCGNSTLCQDNSQCCSQYGYCGVTNAFCGQGCLNGPCAQSGTNPSNALSIAAYAVIFLGVAATILQ